MTTARDSVPLARRSTFEPNPGYSICEKSTTPPLPPPPGSQGFTTWPWNPGAETAVRTANGGSRTKVPGNRGVSMNTTATAVRTAVVTNASERPAAMPVIRSGERTFRTNAGSRTSSRAGRCDRYSHSAASATHGTRKTRKPVPSDSDPASATRIRLEITENDRSRRRGTSKECRTCTHTNNEARGIRAWSTDSANRTFCRKAPRAASRGADNG